MIPSVLQRAASVLAVGAALLAGCAAPSAESPARETVSYVERRLGVAPRWRRGEDLSVEEEARVRELLATPLDERGAVQLALYRSRRLQALIEHAIAEALSAQADAAPSNPVLDALVRWPHGPGGPVLDLGLSFGLLEVLRLPGRGDAASLAARGAALEAAEAIVVAVTGVRSAWVDAVAAQEREELARDIAEAFSVAADLAERQYEAGTLPRFDFLRARAVADDAAATLERSRAESIAASERLVRALGIHGAETPVSVADALPPLPDVAPEPTEAEVRAVERRIDLERARLAVVEARLAAGLAADEHLLPGADVGGSYERESDGARSSGPAVSLPIPLSPKEAAAAEAAKARVREAEDVLFDLAVSVRSEAREAQASFRSAAAVAARYRDSIVPGRAATVEEAQLLYNGMLLGVHDLLAAKREEIAARRDLVEAVRDAWMARIRLDLAVGGEPPSPQPSRQAAHPGGD